MKCPSCAANYDDTFSFCPHCGTSKPQPPTVRIQVEQPIPVHVVAEPRYEYCKLDTVDFGHGRWPLKETYRQMVAKGTTILNEDVVYAESEGKVYYMFDIQEATRVVGRKLIQDGWEPDPPDSRWKFRRRIHYRTEHWF